MNVKTTLSLTAMLLTLSNGVSAVELSNGDNNALLINGKEAATQLDIYDNEGTQLKGFRVISFGGDGNSYGVLTLDSGASLAVSVDNQGIVGAFMNNNDDTSSHLCDIDGNILDSDGILLDSYSLFKTSHYLIVSAQNSGVKNEVYKQDIVEGFTCPTLSQNGDGEVSVVDPGGEPSSAMVLRFDPDATNEFNTWKSNITFPLHVEP